jgi:hypothetical protein
MKVAPRDDYQNVAPGRADWSGATKRAVTSALTDNVAEPNAAIEGLRPFDVIPILRGVRAAASRCPNRSKSGLPMTERTSHDRQ